MASTQPASAPSESQSATQPTSTPALASQSPQPSLAPRMIVGSNTSPVNPTPLSAPQEQQVRDLYYANVRAKCADEIKAFAECATGRTVTAIYACRTQKLAMNACMLQYQGPEEMDRARAQWFTLAAERQETREKQARAREEAKQKHRDWWALDEYGRLQGKKLEVDDKGVRRGGVWGGT